MKIIDRHRSGDLTVEKEYYFINEDTGQVEHVKHSKDIPNNLEKLKEYICE